MVNNEILFMSYLMYWQLWKYHCMLELKIGRKKKKKKENEYVFA